MNNKTRMLCVISTLTISPSSVFAHSGPVTNSSHLIEHLMPALALPLAVAAVVVARVIWLRQHQGS